MPAFCIEGKSDMGLFYPTVLKNRITEITVDELTAMGVKALLLDVDNTLTEHHSQHLDEQTAAWLQTMRENGVALMLVSNSKDPRVRPFAARIGLSYVHTACKPVPFGFWRAAKALGISKAQCLAVGDQSFTDVLGAKLAGVRVVQLMPIKVEDGWSFRLRRSLEKRILAGYARRLARKENVV